MDNKVYVVSTEVKSMYDEEFSFVDSVHKSFSGAEKGLLDAIETHCYGIKEGLKTEFEDEDYAEDYEGYNTFDEFWSEWISERLAEDAMSWAYDDDEELNIFIAIIERPLGE